MARLMSAEQLVLDLPVPVRTAPCAGCGVMLRYEPEWAQPGSERRGLWVDDRNGNTCQTGTPGHPHRPARRWAVTGGRLRAGAGPGRARRPVLGIPAGGSR